MTNKEQIIIDGVDVTQCEYLQYKGCEFAQCLIKMASFDLKCEANNCSYKQLARKTQECEELKEQLQANQPTGICDTCMAKAILQNDKYREALEEIENFTKKHCDYWCEHHRILDIINKAKGLQ